MESTPHAASEAQRPAPIVPVVPLLRLVPLERLRDYPFLAKISEIILKKVQPNLLEQTFTPGQVILRTGDYSDAAYYVSEGRVEICLSGVPAPATARLTPASGRAAKARLKPGATEAPDRREETSEGGLQRVRDALVRIFDRTPLEQAVQRDVAPGATLVLSDMPVDLAAGQRAVLGQGEIFGEMSALSRYPVSADVVALDTVRCLVIRTVALRLLFKQKEAADFKKSIDERYRSRALAGHLRGVELFAGLDDDMIARLQAAAELASFEPGKVIVEEGKPADAFYMVRGGYVKVGVRSGAADLAVTYLRKGDYAGEIALLLDEPWPFSLQALEHVEIVKIPRDIFKEIIGRYPKLRKTLWGKTVRRLKQRGYVQRNPLSSQYVQMAMDTGLIHGESVLLIDLETCTRCDDCVRACADTHGGTPRFIREGLKYRRWSIPTACYQCSDPVCMIGCPTGAISRSIGTLEVTVNKETCTGCHNCSKRCPWGNIIEVPFQSAPLSKQIDLATKCDLCVGRAEGPACVQMCPHGSAIRISFKDFTAVTETLSR